MKLIRKKRTRLSKILYSFIVGILCLVTSFSPFVLWNSKDEPIKSLNESKVLNENTTKSEIIPYDFVYKTPILTQSTGPIISYGSTITSLDWFGAKRWQINLLDPQYAKYFPGGKNDVNNYVHYTNRAFVNWSLDQKNNLLWILTNSYSESGGKTNDGSEKKTYYHSVL